MPALNAYKQNKSYTGAQALFKTIGKLIFGGMHEIYYLNLDFQDAEFLDTCV